MTPTYTVTADTRQLVFLTVTTLVVLVAALTFIAVSCLLERRKHPARADGAQPRPGPNPVPGQPRSPSEAHGPPDVHAPAPAGPHGEPAMVLLWPCGRIRTWDNRGKLTNKRDCNCPGQTDWDAELRDLTPCPDCGTAPGHSCPPGCPRYAEAPGD